MTGAGRRGCDLTGPHRGGRLPHCPLVQCGVAEPHWGCESRPGVVPGLRPVRCEVRSVAPHRVRTLSNPGFLPANTGPQLVPGGNGTNDRGAPHTLRSGRGLLLARPLAEGTGGARETCPRAPAVGAQPGERAGWQTPHGPYVPRRLLVGRGWVVTGRAPRVAGGVVPSPLPPARDSVVGTGTGGGGRCPWLRSSRPDRLCTVTPLSVQGERPAGRRRALGSQCPGGTRRGAGGLGCLGARALRLVGGEEPRAGSRGVAAEPTAWLHGVLPRGQRCARLRRLPASSCLRVFPGPGTGPARAEEPHSGLLAPALRVSQSHPLSVPGPRLVRKAGVPCCLRDCVPVETRWRGGGDRFPRAGGAVLVGRQVCWNWGRRPRPCAWGVGRGLKYWLGLQAEPRGPPLPAGACWGLGFGGGTPTQGLGSGCRKAGAPLLSGRVRGRP